MRTMQRLCVVGLGSVLGVGAALSGVIRVEAAGTTVHNGQSIQTAIDNASPGDTITADPGTYHETLLIRKDSITLRAKDPDAHNTILVPPNPPPNPPNLCTQFNGDLSGICAFAKVIDLQSGSVTTPVKNVTIDGFVIQGFAANGVMGFGVDGLTVKHVSASKDGAYGIVAFSSSRVRFTDNRTSGAGEAGIYLGDSPNADAEIYHNTSWNNQFGIFIRHSQEAEVSDNNSHDNCVGIIGLDDSQPGGIGHLSIKGNSVEHNNKFCPAVSGGREAHAPFSGSGILLVGASDSTVRDNEVEDNKNSNTLQSPASGGILLITAHDFTGGSDPHNNKISGNKATGNAPLDIIYIPGTTGSGNTFKDNDCATSQPGGLCE
jgi:hypothetical protein